MAILVVPSAHPQPPKPEPSMLGQVYRVFGLLALLGAIVAIVFGSLNGRIEAIIAGGVGILAAILLFGLAEFFNQIARIAAATEETARRLREHIPSP